MMELAQKLEYSKYICKNYFVKENAHNGSIFRCNQWLQRHCKMIFLKRYDQNELLNTILQMIKHSFWDLSLIVLLIITKGHRLQLLILLKEEENIIVVLQSPPVFIDSRKSTHDEHRKI
ncbi:unnamed protein product [Paramecium primaurelia]|uniref:Uncharacterized protein n=1 Tax=Paramecium primaurelia TaxID=5886 RepID=A0A8S1K0K9_PARPR|nr:unnamed protein product [Paramecium primaurelia]